MIKVAQSSHDFFSQSSVFMVDEDLLQQYCMLVALTTCLIKFLLDWFSAAFSLPKQIEKSKIQG